MSHTLVVVVGDKTRDVRDLSECEAMLAPYDENIDVDEYETVIHRAGDPIEQWALKSAVRRKEQLPTSVRELYDAVDHDLFPEIGYDPEDDVIVEVSTHNPQSRWDWYTVGGRWRGYFAIKHSIAPERYSLSKLSPFAGPDRVGPARADVARVGDVDFAAMITENRDYAARRFDKMAAIVAEFDMARYVPWSVCLEQEPNVDSARQRFGSQPVIKAMRSIGYYTDDPENFLPQNRVGVLREAESDWVPYSLLDSDGWSEKGKMGWFGMSEPHPDADTWEARCAERLRSLPPETVLFAVDVHI